MLSKSFIYHLKQRYCIDDYTQIEGFWEAYNDDLPSRKHCLHHKYGLVLNKTKEQLDYMGLYYHRYARELQIMLRSDHTRLHNRGKCRNFSEEHKRNISEGKKDKPLSEEHKRNISEALKGKASCNKGTHYYNNGVIEVRTFECPEGFVSGKLKRNIK